MRSLGLDRGDKRTGVAISDSSGIMAVPLIVIENDSEDIVIANVLKLVDQYEVECIVIGLPRSLDGSLGQQADKIMAFVDKLSSSVVEHGTVNIKIKLWDERFSTVAAEKLMVKTGAHRNKIKKHRDAMAAALILQGFLDSIKE
jgi:putative holliday junction resolvase